VFESGTKCNIKKTEFRKLVLIIALSITGVLVFSNCSYAQTLKTVPDPPTGFTATAISPTSVSLSWSMPQNNGGAAITGYKIEYKVPTSNYALLNKTGNVTQYTNKGLSTGTTYIYRVSAINSVGIGNPSLEAVATPKKSSSPPLNIPPNPPTSLIATSYSATQINLSWISPTDNGGPPVTGYKIQYEIDFGNFTNLVSNTGSSYTSYSNTGLTTTHTYTYRVFAINSVGTSNSSNTATAIPVQISTVPDPPTGLGAFPSSETSISLSWNPPKNTGGSSIIGYDIKYKTGSNEYSVLVANTASPATSYTKTGLTAGTAYTFRVSAINCIGMGGSSNEASAMPAKTFTPSGVTAIAVSPTAIGLSWFPPSETYGETVTGYKIDKKLSPNVYDTIIDSTGLTTNYSINNLVTGKTYTFVVTALFLGGGQSNPSAEVSATPTSTSALASISSSSSQCTSKPDPPTGFALKASKTSVKLSWVAPLNNNKSPVTGYKIEFKTSLGGWLVLIPNAGNSTTYLHTGLSPDIYTYRVSTINLIGTSNPSTEASVSLFPNNSTTPVPGAPEVSGGTIAVTNTDFTLNYNAIGGQILGTTIDRDTFSLHIKMGTKSDGVLFMQLPRDLIDSKKADGSDDVYYVLADKQPVKFNETKSTIYRTLAINFPAQTGEITIYGTHVIPEFPVVSLALIVALIPAIFFSRFLSSKKLA
jgi:predicted phage tail protein